MMILRTLFVLALLAAFVFPPDLSESIVGHFVICQDGSIKPYCGPPTAYVSAGVRVSADPK